MCTVINWAEGVSMALSYFGLQLGSLTLAASLAWILSSHFLSQVGFNLENVELGFNFFSRIFEIQAQAKGCNVL